MHVNSWHSSASERIHPPCNCSALEGRIKQRLTYLCMALICIFTGENCQIHVQTQFHFINFPFQTRSPTRWCLHVKCMCTPIDIPHLRATLQVHVTYLQTCVLDFPHCQIFGQKNIHDLRSNISKYLLCAFICIWNVYCIIPWHVWLPWLSPMKAVCNTYTDYFIYHHSFTTLHYNMALGRSTKTRRDWNWMGHISYWSTLIMLIYPAKIWMK